MINFEILKLSELDPEKDIIIVNVFVGDKSSSDITKLLKWASKHIGEQIKKKGFTAVFVPVTSLMAEMGFTTFEVFRNTTNEELNLIPTPKEEPKKDPIDITREVVSMSITG